MKKLVLSGLLFGGAIVGAHAETALFSIEGMVQGKSRAVNINYRGGDLTVMSGPVHGRLNGGDLFEAYCVDLDNWNSARAQYEVNVRPIVELNNGAQAAYLFNTYASGVASANLGAALQIAIWDTVADGGDGLAEGDFKATVGSEVRNLANQYIQDAKGKSGDALWLEALNHTRPANHGINQNYMACPVPEPSTIIALATAAIGMASRRRRNK